MVLVENLKSFHLLFWRKLRQENGLTPFESVDFFGLFLKRILFYPQYQKTIFSRLICPKNTDNKKILFFD